MEEQPTVQFDQGSLWTLKSQWPHEACRQERPGSRWGPGKPPGNVWDAEGSVLPAKPDFQNGVSSATPGSGLEPLSRGQGSWWCQGCVASPWRWTILVGRCQQEGLAGCNHDAADCHLAGHHQ